MILNAQTTDDNIQTSLFICNRCAYSDEEYERIFGEPKEEI